MFRSPKATQMQPPPPGSARPRWQTGWLLSAGRRAAERFARQPAIVLALVGLLATGVAWRLADRMAEQDAQARLDLIAGRLSTELAQKLHQHATILHGARSLLSLLPASNRAQWHDYVETLAIAHNFPGLIDLLLLRPEPLSADTAHLARLAEPSPVDADEVCDAKSPSEAPYLGHFICGDPAARAALDRARDSGQMVMSDVLQFDQPGGPRTGAVIVAPVYHAGGPYQTDSARRAALRAWIVLPIVAAGLLSDVTIEATDVNIEWLDTSSVPARVMFDRDGHLSGSAEPSRASYAGRSVARSEVGFGGRHWQIIVSQRRQAAVLPLTVLAGGLVASALLAMVGWSFGSSRARALSLAAHMTAALEATKNRFDAAVRGSGAGLWDWDAEAARIYYSPRLHELLGLADGSLAGRFHALARRLHTDDRRLMLLAIRRSLRHKATFDCELRLRCEGAGYRWMQALGRPVAAADGRVSRLAGSLIIWTPREPLALRVAG